MRVLTVLAIVLSTFLAFPSEPAYPARASAWSPDGSRLLVATTEGLRIAEGPDFTNARLVVRTPSSPADEVAWAPDGTRIVFVAARPGDSWSTIWIASADGTNVRDLLPPGSPVVSTGNRAVGLTGWDDRHRLVFWSHCGTECLEFQTLDLASGTTSRLCYGSEAAVWPEGAPRGAYTNTWHGRSAVVERVPGADTEPMAVCRTLFDSPDSDPHHIARSFDSWASDRRHFLYTAWTPAADEAGGVGVGTPTLAIGDVASSSRRVLSTQTAWGAWSPDGTRVAATRLAPAVKRTNELAGALVILDAKTGAQLASAPLGIAARERWIRRDGPLRELPAWSSDGAIVVVQNVIRALLRVDATTGAAAVLTKRPAAARWAAGSARRLAITMIDESRPFTIGHGLDRYLPPFGSGDPTPAAERVERYYGAARAACLDGYCARAFMNDHAYALWALGRKSDAERLLREALAAADDGVDGPTRRENLALFLHCTGRDDEARRIAPPPVPSPIAPGERETVGGRLLTPEEAANLPKPEDPCIDLDATRPRTGGKPADPPNVYVVVLP